MTPNITAPEALTQRWHMLSLASQAAWLGLLVVGLLATCLMPPEWWRGLAFGGSIDVPPDLAVSLKAAGVEVVSGKATVGGWPGTAYSFFCLLLWLTTVSAAARGRWEQFFACQVLLLMPPEPFGIAMQGVTGNAAIVGGFVACGRAFFTKRRNYIVPVVAVMVFILTAQSLMAGQTRPEPVIYPSSGAIPAAKQADRLQDLETALAAMPSEQRSAVLYVRAQLAYSQGDKQALRALGPIGGKGFTHNRFTGRRLAVLAGAWRRAAGEPAPWYLAWPGALLGALIGAGFVVLFLLSLLTGRMEGRVKRLGNIATELQRLRMA